jgi:GNAT superfamily N-acetyltransferase
MQFVQANEQSIIEVSRLLTDAAIWLQQANQPLWPVEEVTVDVLRRDTSSYYLCYVEDVPAGTLRFQLEDPDFWPEINGGSSTFIHKVAVDRRFAGQGISTALLQWALDTTRSLGRQYLRVDFDPSREALKNLYEGFGFEFHSPKDMGSFFVHRYVYTLQDSAEV